MSNYPNRFLIILIGMLLVKTAFSQQVYFINQSNRMVYITKRTVLEEGSYPYALVKDSKKLQSIPLQTTDAAIYNVHMEEANGSYGTNSGKYYLLKPNDTIILTKNNELLHLTHQSSALRNYELAMGEGLIEGLSVKPFYMLDPNKQMVLQNSPVAQKDKIIDSLSIPVINYIEEYCRANHINPEIGKLYHYNFMGMRYYQKLYTMKVTTNAVYAKQINTFYKDSVAKWANEFTCNTCTNVPFYNLAAKATFDLLYENLTPAGHLNAIASYTKGNTRDFLLSAYIVDRVEANTNGLSELMALYNKLCSNPIYKKIVADNYILATSASPTTSKGLAMLMTADKKHIDFNEMLKACKGKIVYIDFWASWCQPCLAELPFSLKLHNKLKAEAVKMVYISTDRDFNNWTSMAKTKQINNLNSYILVNAGKDGLSKLLSLSSIPRYLIIGKDGKFINTDASRPSEARTYQLLKALASK